MKTFTERAAELQQKWGTELGQLWQIGPHRLLIGDCTEKANVGRLCAGTRPSCMWTDPPYGVSYVGKTKAALTIQNDGAEGLAGLLRDAFRLADEVLIEGAPVYVAHPAGALSVVFDTTFVAQGWRLHQTIIWLKDSMVLGHSDYHFKHEPITFGYKPGEGRFGRGWQHWYGDDSQVSVLEVSRPKASEEHPTMKPPELITRCLQNSTKAGDVVYEPFAGSGSTFVAAEHLGRACYGLELELKYAAVICERMSALGLTPELTEG